MKTTLSLVLVLALGLVIGIACDWNVINEDQETEDEIECALNPGIPGYDCGDACCGWENCGSPPLYEEYGDCVNKCNEALFINISDNPNYSEGYKICVLDCIHDCDSRNTCMELCKGIED